MKKCLFVAVAAACAAFAAWAYYAYLENNRFVVTNAGGGAVYKADRKTGKTTVLYQGKELEVQQYVFVQPTPTPTPQQETAEEAVARWEQEFLNEAVALAKEARTVDQSKFYTKTNDQYLTQWLSQQKGDIRFNGWSAKKVDAQTYLVTYALVRDGKSEGVRLEVNLPAKLVRNVKGDPALEAKYSSN
jgi:hypothetical protein